MTGPRVLITGGAGFIGTRLAHRLRALGHNVHVFDNFCPQVHDGSDEAARLLAADGISVHRGDVRDRAALRQVLSRSDPQQVYHLAALTGTGQSFHLPGLYCDVNVVGTSNLIEAIRDTGTSVRRVILASSRAVYGEGACIDADGRPTPAVERRATDMALGDFRPKDAGGRPLTPVKTAASCPVNPMSVYASTKLMQENLLRQGFWGTDVGIGILRLQNIYGPGQSLNNPYTGVLSIFCRRIQDGHGLDIFEDGNIVRDFLLVDDAVSAFVAMGLAAQVPAEVLDIGSGAGVSILDVARRLLALMGADPRLAKVCGAFRAGDIRHAVADTSLALGALGWSPEFSLDQGLARLADWADREFRAIA